MVTTKYHHINEVFNALSHDHAYSVVKISLGSGNVYFDKDGVNTLVATHFSNNLKKIDYEYKVVFYVGNTISRPRDNSNKFKVNLYAELGFNVIYDKTFTYYIT